jgi:hypothetical protein
MNRTLGCWSWIDTARYLTMEPVMIFPPRSLMVLNLFACFGFQSWMMTCFQFWSGVFSIRKLVVIHWEDYKNHAQRNGARNHDVRCPTLIVQTSLKLPDVHWNWLWNKLSTLRTRNGHLVPGLSQCFFTSSPVSPRVNSNLANDIDTSGSPVSMRQESGSTESESSAPDWAVMRIGS